jgi:hypothetical protein
MQILKMLILQIFDFLNWIVLFQNVLFFLEKMTKSKMNEPRIFNSTFLLDKLGRQELYCKIFFIGLLFSIEKYVEKTLLTLEAYKRAQKRYFGEISFAPIFPCRNKCHKSSFR